MANGRLEGPRRGRLAGVVALSLMVLASCETRPPLEDDLAALGAFSTSWRAAYQAGNFESMADLYEPDAWLMTRNQPARKGREAILDYFRTSREAGGEAVIVFEREERTIDGDYAFQIARWWLESPEATGEPVRDSGRSLVIFKRSADGRWRLWRDIDNNTPDVTFPIPEALLQ
ncbi:MAG: SgcJ/EcaC family oxidoreductase [Pseudomonadota bacterium]